MVRVSRAGVRDDRIARVRRLDIVILATFADMSVEEARSYKPRVVRVDEHNRIVPGGFAEEKPGPILSSLPKPS